MKRIVLVGSPAPVLKLLHACDGVKDVAWVTLFATAPPAEPLETRVRELGMGIEDARALGDAAGVKRLEACAPDWIFSLGASLPLPEGVVPAARSGALGASADAAPLAIRNGDPRVTVRVRWLADEVTAYARELDVRANETGLSITTRYLGAATALLAEAVAEIGRGGTPPRIPYDPTRHHATSPTAVPPEPAIDFPVDWTKSSQEIVRAVRAADFAPFSFPGPRVRMGAKRVRILRAEPEGSYRGTPGTVADTGPRGVFVPAGDGTGVRIECVALKTGETLCGGDIAARLGIAPGDVLQ